MHISDRTTPNRNDFWLAREALIDESLDDSGEEDRPIACGLVAEWIGENLDVLIDRGLLKP